MIDEMTTAKSITENGRIINFSRPFQPQYFDRQPTDQKRNAYSSVNCTINTNS